MALGGHGLEYPPNGGTGGLITRLQVARNKNNNKKSVILASPQLIAPFAKLDQSDRLLELRIGRLSRSGKPDREGC